MKEVRALIREEIDSDLKKVETMLLKRSPDEDLEADLAYLLLAKSGDPDSEEVAGAIVYLARLGWTDEAMGMLHDFWARPAKRA